MDKALLARALVNRTVQFDADVRIEVVGDSMHGIQLQPVEVIFLQPVKRLVNKKIAHRTTRTAEEIDGGAPGCLVPVGEEILGVDIKR
jgi:hypothetical protein